MYMRVPNDAGRDIGIPRMSSVVQIPSRSGWPHAVRGVFQCGFVRLAADASAEPFACAAARVGSATRRVHAARTPIDEHSLWIMAKESITR
jgi:hypothetical protein